MDLEQLCAELDAPQIRRRLRAIAALAVLRVDESHKPLLEDALRRGLRDLDPLVRAESSDAVIDQRLGGLAPTLAGLLELDSDATVRASAAEALGEVGSEAVVPALVAALTDVDGAVRTFAANSLSLVATPNDGRHLTQALRNEAEESVRFDFRLALLRLGDDSVIAAILRDILVAASADVRATQMLNGIADLVTRPRFAGLPLIADRMVETLLQARSTVARREVGHLDQIVAQLAAYRHPVE